MQQCYMVKEYMVSKLIFRTLCTWWSLIPHPFHTVSKCKAKTRRMSFGSVMFAILADNLYIVAAFLDPQHKLKWCKKSEAKCAEVKAIVLDLMRKVDVVAARSKPTHPAGPPRKKRGSLLQYSDDEDGEDEEREGLGIKGCETELQLYIDSPKSHDVLHFWESKKHVFPRLYAITRKIFCVPGTTAGVERLFNISGYIFSNKRMRLTDRNFEDQVFTHCNSDLLGSVGRKRTA